MGLNPGDRVRCYNSATHVWEVVETDVDFDVAVDSANVMWRVPDGDTLVRNTQKDGVYMVVPSRLISEMD